MKYFKLLLVILFFLPGIYSYSQSPLTSYGKIGIDELEMTGYDKDPDAEAVVLYDIGASYFAQWESSFRVIFHRRCRIKILSEAGVDFANISIPFYVEDRNYEEVRNVVAKTYNYVDGTIDITTLKNADIYTEKLGEFWMLKKFAMPKAKVGSVIEFSYELVSPYLYHLQDWNFQNRIPTVYSEYEVRMIPFYEYQWILVGAKGFNSQKSYLDNKFRSLFGSDYHDMVHKYIMKDIPAFKDDEYIRSVDDRLIKIDFQLAKITDSYGSVTKVSNTWEALIKDFLKNEAQGRFLKKCKRNAGKIIDLNAMKEMNPNERMNKIVSFVKGNYDWNGWDSRNASQKVSDFLKNKRGNSAEINLLLSALLSASGINASPMLVSTREHGKLRLDYPFKHFFNHIMVFAVVGSEEYLLDASDYYSSNINIPFKCVNDKGLVVLKGNVMWKDLEIDIKSNVNSDISVSFDKEIKELTCKIINEYENHAGYIAREEYINEESTIYNLVRDEGYNVIKESIKTKNFSEFDKPYIVSFESSQKADVIIDKLYVSPFMNETITINPLTQKVRKLTVDFGYSQKFKYVSTVIIPDGYKISYMPEDFDFSNELMDIIYKSKVEGNNIKVTFYYHFKLPVYMASDYLRLKYYFNEIIKLSTEKIVLEKV